MSDIREQIEAKLPKGDSFSEYQRGRWNAIIEVLAIVDAVVSPVCQLLLMRQKPDMT